MFSSLLQLLGIQTAIITALSIASTWACREYGFVAEFPLTLIGTAIVFPIVFSISGAYKRREVTLDEYGSIKAHGRAIYYAARDWIEGDDPALLEEASARLEALLKACRTLFQTPVRMMERREREVYHCFSELSLFIKGFRARGLSTGEVSRCNQFLSKMVIAFENVKHIYQYRTPRALRAYSQFFIYLLPILYGPYFAAISMTWRPQLVYVMPVLFSVVLVSLENIQEHLENPFDQVGEDDVQINAEKFVERLAA